MENKLFNKWKKGTKRLAIVYPNKEFGGIYSLGPLIVYNLANKQKNWVCERLFLENSDLKNFDLIGFTFQYELDYRNFFRILEKNNISLSTNRKQIIFAGGPCVTANPKPLDKNVDFFILGEAEEVLPVVLGKYSADKNLFLEKISKINGVYVPGKNSAASAALSNIDDYSYPLVQPIPENINEKYVFGKSFILETERGCPYSCHFCSINSFYSGFKYRSLHEIKKIIDEGVRINRVKKVVIYSPSFLHPNRKEILNYLLSKNLKFSVPSLRVEFVDEELLRLIEKGGQKTLTVAPECNERLRYKINKRIKDELFFKFLEIANKFNFNTIKMYFMLGLPDQTGQDLTETVDFIKNAVRISKKEIYVSVNPFVPKPKTEFENFKFDKKNVRKQIAFFRKELNKIKIRYKISNLQTSHLEWKYASGS